LVEGASKRSIQREYQIHWKTLQKILQEPEPPGYRQANPRPKKKLGPFLAVLEEILRQDQQAPPKQRHTARRIFERLRDEHGYAGGLTMVKVAVQAWRRKGSEVFVPLSHPPGEAQMDFGHAEVVLDGTPTKVALFVMTLPFSDALFCCVFPRECTEAFLEGHRRAFEFFGGVPRRISYDNSKIAIAKITGNRTREVTREFQRLQSHYLFASHFCLVRRANEKGHVENLVGYARRNFLVPVPTVESIEALNDDLQARCRVELDRQVRGKAATKDALLVEERASFSPLPAQAFESRRVVAAKANSLALVRFDRNDYSVPTAYAHHAVMVIGGIDEVRLVVGPQLVARHRRCWQKEQTRFDPVHYLALLERKPGALDFARPLEGWQLPDCFGVLRRRLEAELQSGGTREYIKVLRLLESAPMTQLGQAVEHALAIGASSADAVRLILEHRREQPVGLFRLDGHLHLKAVRVHEPNLKAYRALVSETSVSETSVSETSAESSPAAEGRP
jgi:transposase